MRNKNQLLAAICIVIGVIKGYSQIPTLNPFFFGQKPQKTNVTLTNLTSIGQYYADLQWNAGNIHLKNGDSLIAYYMRYDLVRNHLEVIIDTKIMAINGSFIDRFEWFSIERLRPEKFMNKNQYSLESLTDIAGFPELLVDGDVKLFKCKIVFAPRQATSPTLVNDTDSEIQVLEEYYYEKEGEIFEVTGNKRKNLDFLERSSLNKHLKENDLRFNAENDLIKIIQYVNDK
ncbi:hypothetical protein AAOE16_09265 [Ekhidna sp. MALMAid0563]|uniref:hypothetical protein n=1 Tax=Ekhidna sp. MALMAid0563 TaxID=3143937 RepID=UPI0032DF1EF1